MVNSYSAEEINKIQVIRIHIEKLCVKLAIKNATDEEIKSLREFTKTQNMQNDSSKTNNTQFHMRLSEITKNEFIPKILYDILVKATSVIVKAESDLESHDKIIDALLKRDEKEAVERLIEDIKLM